MSDSSQLRYEKSVELVASLFDSNNSTELYEEDICLQHADLMPELRAVFRTASSLRKAIAPKKALAPGEMVQGRYRIVQELSRGGMGKVYRAKDLLLGQPIALKFLSDRVNLNDTIVSRFIAEAKHARSISHPNVCRVHDIGNEHGSYFLTMEFINGETLADLRERSLLTPRMKINIARQICSGLLEAHRIGIIHADLKPSNIMMDEMGQVRITDFGLAVRQSQQSDDERFAGTIAYMAPEQFAGDEVTVQSDLYSLGLVLFELFTGDRYVVDQQHKHDLEACIHRALNETSDASKETVSAVIRQCLLESPEHRPGSVKEVLETFESDDLSVAQENQSIPTPELVATRRAPTTSRIIAFSLLAAVLLSWMTHAYFATDMRFFSDAKVNQNSKDELRAKASTLLSSLGFALLEGDKAADGINYLSIEKSLFPDTAETSVEYWYRQSPVPLIPNIVNMTRDLATISISADRPTMTAAGDVRVRYSFDGTLHKFDAIPNESSKLEINESLMQLWNAADLHIEDCPDASSLELTAVLTDVRTRDEAGLKTVKVSRDRGQIRRFEVKSTTKPSRSKVPGWAKGVGFSELLFWILFCIALIMARRNLRRGICDRRGAIKLAIVAGACATISWIVLANHLSELKQEMRLVRLGVTNAAFWAGAIALVYAALEPIARNADARKLVSWHRLLHTRWTDGLVARDILIGMLLPLAAAPLLSCLDLGVRAFFDMPSRYPVPTDELWMLNGTHMVPAVCFALSSGIYMGFALFMLPILTKFVVRSAAVSNGIVILLATAFLYKTFSGSSIWMLVYCGLWAFIFVGSGIRWGLLASVTTAFTHQMVMTTPFTSSPSDWYFSSFVASSLIIATIAVTAAVVPFFGQSTIKAKTIHETKLRTTEASAAIN